MLRGCGAAGMALKEVNGAARQVDTVPGSRPLPVHDSALYAVSCLSQKKYAEVACVLGSHFESAHVAKEMVKVLAASQVEDASGRLAGLAHVCELLHKSGAPESVPLLECMAHLCVSAGPAVSPELCEDTRRIIVRQMRFSPTWAPTLLGPLCLVSTPSKSHCEDVMSFLQIAMREGFVSPRDMGRVLSLLVAASKHYRVAGLWEWMKDSSACWDTAAASAAIVAFSHLGRLEAAVTTIHCLAEVNLNPSIEAQAAFVRHLATRSTPLPQYADQVVSHWFNGQCIWTGAAQRVGVPLLLAHFYAGDKIRTVELLLAAAAALKGKQKEALSFARTDGVHQVMLYCADEIRDRKELQYLMFGVVVVESWDSSYAPALISAQLHLGWRLDRLPDVYDAASRATFTDQQFVAVLKSFGEIQQRHSDPKEIAATMQKVAAHARKEVPPDISAWMELLCNN